MEGQSFYKRYYFNTNHLYSGFYWFRVEFEAGLGIDIASRCQFIIPPSKEAQIKLLLTK